MSVNHSAGSGDIIGIFSTFFNMKVYCVYSLVRTIYYAQYTISNIKTENHPLQLQDFFQGTEERVRNSSGKRAIRVRAIEVLLYIFPLNETATHSKICFGNICICNKCW